MTANWIDESGDEYSFELFTGINTNNEGISLLTAATADVITYLLYNNYNPATQQIAFRMRSVKDNAGGYGYSQFTPAVYTPPLPATITAVTNPAANLVSVTWTHPFETQQGWLDTPYVVEMKNLTQAGGWVVVQPNLPLGTLAYVHNLLDDPLDVTTEIGDTIQVRVKAQNGADISTSTLGSVVFS